MMEKAIQFGNYKNLIGVLTEPDNLPEDHKSAVLLINAGLIHRIGPNRLYVKLARALAAQGYYVIRFDLSGVGDSLPRPDHMTVEQYTIDDTLQAMDYLASNYGCRRFVLMGHCAGAYHSFRTAALDQRVAGVVMMNPDAGESDWVEYDRKRKLARYYMNYYGKETLLDSQRWKRFFSGKINYGNVIRNTFHNVIWGQISGLFFRMKQRFIRKAPIPADSLLFTIEGILQKLVELNTRVLLIYSENATSLERIRSRKNKELKQLTATSKLNLTVIPGADHIFSPLDSQSNLLQVIGQWMNQVKSVHP